MGSQSCKYTEELRSRISSGEIKCQKESKIVTPSKRTVEDFEVMMRPHKISVKLQPMADVLDNITIRNIKYRRVTLIIGTHTIEAVLEGAYWYVRELIPLFMLSEPCIIDIQTLDDTADVNITYDKYILANKDKAKPSIVCGGKIYTAGSVF